MLGLGLDDEAGTENEDMKSERLVIKSTQLFERIMTRYDSLRAFQRHLRGVVSLSTLSNWIQERPGDKPWVACSTKVARVAEVLGCSLGDIAQLPNPKPPPMNSRFLLRVALAGTSEQLMDLDVWGQELSLAERGTPNHALHGNLLSVGGGSLTGHLRIYPPMAAQEHAESGLEGALALLPEEMTLQARCDGEYIRGVLVVRDRRGDIRAAHFEGVRKGVSRRQSKRAARC
jgi:hypothetical protein